MRFKHLMILAAVTVMAMSCINNFEATPTPQAEIGFGTWANTLTKTTVADPTNPRVQGSNVFRTGDGIVVYGSKVISQEATVVFDGVDVVATAETNNAASTWDYNTHRFWDRNADSYIFFAVSPKDKLATTTSTATNGAFETNSLSFAGNNNDFLVADKAVVNKGNDPATYFNSYGTVNLMFNHAAALVDVCVKKSPALAGATVKVSSIELRKIKSVGTLTINENSYNKSVDTRTTVPNIALSNWAPETPATYTPANGVVPVKGDDGSNDISANNAKTIVADANFSTGNSTSNTTPAASTILFNNLIVVPQAFEAPTNEEIANPESATTAQHISITYSIEVGEEVISHTSYLWLSQFDRIDNGTQAAEYVGSWEPGKHYTFYITIDAHAITFSASIDPWTPVSGYHYLVN